jgi:hypothetical protein
MAAALSAKPKKGKRQLSPFYIGTTQSKSLTNKIVSHTHYVLIDGKVVTQLGLKLKQTAKPGGLDFIRNGLVFQSNRKKTTGDKRPMVAKRFVQQSSKPITAYCKTYVKDRNGKEVQESYSIGFPSNVPLRLIIKFFKDFCFNVTSIGTGSNRYQVR